MILVLIDSSNSLRSADFTLKIQIFDYSFVTISYKELVFIV